ncbi:MAG: Ku protein [Myxococcales bacterium]|nr:Ku protein [Myxococcales bacterium]
MAARATASGTISFGLVSIPVKLYSASRSRAVRFNMLDPKHHARVKQQYVSAATGEKLERSDLVKGYEYARDQYVVFTEDELKALEAKSDRTIEIEAFVPIAEVDPLFYEKSNLLGPDKGGQKAYKLLCEAMKRAGMVAIGRFATRGRQQLVLVRPVDDGLVLHGLFYADEVQSFDDIEFGDPVDLKSGELELAEQLIAQLARKSFDPERYEDGYRQAVLAAVERKVAGEEVVAAAPEQEREQIVDLVAALKQSLSARRGAKKTAAKARPKRKMAKVEPEASGKAKGGRKKASRKKAASK